MVNGDTIPIPIEKAFKHDILIMTLVMANRWESVFALLCMLRRIDCLSGQQSGLFGLLKSYWSRLWPNDWGLYRFLHHSTHGAWLVILLIQVCGLIAVSIAACNLDDGNRRPRLNAASGPAISVWWNGSGVLHDVQRAHADAKGNCIQSYLD